MVSHLFIWSLIKISMWRARKTNKSVWILVAIAIWTLWWSECQAFFFSAWFYDFPSSRVQFEVRSALVVSLIPGLFLLRYLRYISDIHWFSFDFLEFNQLGSQLHHCKIVISNVVYEKLRKGLAKNQSASLYFPPQKCTNLGVCLKWNQTMVFLSLREFQENLNIIGATVTKENRSPPAAKVTCVYCFHF